MSKAEELIRECTRSCSNVVAYSGMIEGSELRYHEWLTPDQARRACEIAREEVIEKAVGYIKKDWFQMMMYDYNCYGGCEFNLDKTIERFKQAMKGERYDTE